MTGVQVWPHVERSGAVPADVDKFLEAHEHAALTMSERRLFPGPSPVRFCLRGETGEPRESNVQFSGSDFDGPSSIQDVPKRSRNIAKRVAKKVSSIFMKISPPSVSRV